MNIDVHKYYNEITEDTDKSHFLNIFKESLREKT